MIRKWLVVGSILTFAFSILFISILRVASVKYTFRLAKESLSEILASAENKKLEEIDIGYRFPFPGTVLPDHPLWFLKAARDKIWLLMTPDPYKKAELNLLFADKRIGAAKILFEKKKYNLGIATLSKAEKYLEMACDIEDEVREKGGNTTELADILIRASLAHRQIIKQMMLIAPDDSRTQMMFIENYPRGVYGRKIHVIKNAGLEVIPDPFNGL